MDPIENPVTPPAENQDLQAQVERLRQLVQSILALTIIVSGTFTIFLLRQVKYTSTELEGLRAQATNVVNQYQKTVGPATDDFVRRLAAFSRTHPDFQAIASKYGLENALTNMAPAAAPAAKPVAPAKK